LLVLQPPLPLQSFLPLQPLSLVLQPPWPLHEFCPLPSCLPLSESSASWPAVVFDSCVGPSLVAAWRRMAEPDMRPARATVASMVFVLMLLFFIGSFLV
jgi:hypothetical protein